MSLSASLSSRAPLHRPGPREQPAAYRLWPDLWRSAGVHTAEASLRHHPDRPGRRQARVHDGVWKDGDEGSSDQAISRWSRGHRDLLQHHEGEALDAIGLTSASKGQTSHLKPPFTNCLHVPTDLSQEDPLPGDAEADPSVGVSVPAEVRPRKPLLPGVPPLRHRRHRFGEHTDEEQGPARHVLLPLLRWVPLTSC